MGIPALRIMADDAAFLAGRKIDQSLHGRILTERAVVRKACETLIAADFALRLHNGEDWATEMSAPIEHIMAELMATDMETLWVYRDLQDGAERIGSILLVYGNDGYDVIADYALSLEETLKPVEAFAQTLESGAIFMWPGDLPQPTAQPIAGAALDDVKRFAAGFARAEFAPDTTKGA